MSIRTANSSDAPRLRSLVSDLSRFYLRDPDAPLPTWLASSLSEAEFLDRLSGNDYYNYVYELDGEVVAYISIKRPGHLYHLFVVELHQGQGIARLLWEHTAKLLDDCTYTVRSSLNAIPVYKRFGFVESASVGEKDGVLYQPMELRQNVR
ncbi:MAG: GNAT family N-acetyltransferase [Gammaproteobacteria bacterium HGW-Gammaproteobacteria-15]|nr:MAG: GNAT family N-acetyltransferase [Gammaproteobacteria bacterium HGW-Gammaproteobacteria-15]